MRSKDRINNSAIIDEAHDTTILKLWREASTTIYLPCSEIELEIAIGCCLYALTCENASCSVLD
jgi:hypothetical protein